MNKPGRNQFTDVTAASEPSIDLDVDLLQVSGERTGLDDDMKRHLAKSKEEIFNLYSVILGLNGADARN